MKLTSSKVYCWLLLASLTPLGTLAARASSMATLTFPVSRNLLATSGSQPYPDGGSWDLWGGSDANGARIGTVDLKLDSDPDNGGKTRFWFEITLDGNWRLKPVEEALKIDFFQSKEAAQVDGTTLCNKQGLQNPGFLRFKFPGGPVEQTVYGVALGKNSITTEKKYLGDTGMPDTMDHSCSATPPPTVEPKFLMAIHLDFIEKPVSCADPAVVSPDAICSLELLRYAYSADTDGKKALTGTAWAWCEAGRNCNEHAVPRNEEEKRCGKICSKPLPPTANSAKLTCQTIIKCTDPETTELCTVDTEDSKPLVVEASGDGAMCNVAGNGNAVSSDPYYGASSQNCDTCYGECCKVPPPGSVLSATCKSSSCLANKLGNSNINCVYAPNKKDTDGSKAWSLKQDCAVALPGTGDGKDLYPSMELFTCRPYTPQCWVDAASTAGKPIKCLGYAACWQKVDQLTTPADSSKTAPATTLLNSDPVVTRTLLSTVSSTATTTVGKKVTTTTTTTTIYSITTATANSVTYEYTTGTNYESKTITTATTTVYEKETQTQIDTKQPTSVRTVDSTKVTTASVFYERVPCARYNGWDCFTNGNSDNFKICSCKAKNCKSDADCESEGETCDIVTAKCVAAASFAMR